jgi:hypothetical protein
MAKRPKPDALAPVPPVTTPAALKPYQIGTPLAPAGTHIVSREVLDGIILPAMRQGLPVSTAAALVSIPQSTASQWLSQGRKDLDNGVWTTHAALATDTAKAEAEAQQRLLGDLDRIGGDAKQWVSKAWQLERRWPKTYGQRQDSAESGPRILIQIGALDSGQRSAGQATARRVWPKIETATGGDVALLRGSADSVPSVDAVVCDDAE